MIGVERIGKYEVVGHLASGGMGQVYLARTTGLGGFERQVVVKTLEPDELEDDSLVKMFLDEARILGALHHQFIAPVYEVGCDERGCYYIVMDYVRGETAEAVWRAARQVRSSPPIPFALTVVAAVASALEYAHAMRAPDGSPLEIVHRDVSLSNVMIGHDGAVKLIDFGIAKFSQRSIKTQTGSLKGKLAYLSPEQILSKPVDHRADIFALGIVLYELTTLVRAFEADSPLLTLEKITRGDLALPSRHVPEYPRELELIVMKALALDPDLRYQDAGALGRDLEAFASRSGITLGHAAVAETMLRLFEVTPPGGRRRFARASSDVSKSMLAALPEPDDIDLTPVTPIPNLDPPTERTHLELEDPTVPLEMVTPALPRPGLRPAPPVAEPLPEVPPPAPLVIRIGTPATAMPAVRPPSSSGEIAVPRTATGTDQVRISTALHPNWWWPLAIFCGLTAFGILLALLR